MKRWTIRIVFCLILGAATTVGVAWGIIVYPRDAPGFLEPDTGDNAGVFIVSDPRISPWGHHIIALGPGRIRVSYTPGRNATTWLDWIEQDRYQAALPEWSRFREPARVSEAFIDAGLDGMCTYRELASGWPLLSLRSSLVTAFTSEGRFAYVGAEPLGAPLRSGTELPLRPILPGFIINTLFYAAIWFVLFFGFGFVKRTIRRKRGRCLRCGYDLRGNVANGQDARSTSQDVRSIGCPECGWNRAEINDR